MAKKQLAEKSAGRKTIVRIRTKPHKLTYSDMEHFLIHMKSTGRSDETISKYRGDLNRFYEFLDREKLIYTNTLSQWKQSMIEDGYAPRTINSRIVAVNRFLAFVGCRDWQLFDWMELEETEGMELTRAEYQMLLAEAKSQENIQLYLIVKALACVDLTPSDLVLVTREAVNEGVVSGRMRGADRTVMLPELLRTDLLDFAIQRGIRSGPIFLNRNKKPYGRTVITSMVSALGNEVGLEPGKANPRNLRNLYLNTLAEFQKTADSWVANSYRKLLADEENQIGWRVWMTANSTLLKEEMEE